MGGLIEGEARRQGVVLREGSFACPNAHLQWAVAQVPIDGETECGDSFIVEFSGQTLLAAVVDGLGHGPDAALASQRACAALRDRPGHGLPELIRDCHEALRSTRGAALTLAQIEPGTSMLTWLSVGNVEAIVLRHDPTTGRRSDRVVMRGGVVGYQLPPLVPTTTTVAPGDLLVLASDGLPPAELDGSVIDLPPVTAAQTLLERRTRADDALVLVVRYLGEAA